jgi:N5-(cytidine 5'-diphosphoramidyl)-L-glutamine hydrolase
MRPVAISQRVDIIHDYEERRDSLDQNWIKLLLACNLFPLLIPNHKSCAENILASTPVAGVVLTGGNDLVAYGGNTPERDETEHFLMQYALEKKLPLLGVCRGMQMIQYFYGIELTQVQGHVATKHKLMMDGNLINVNSYHNFGATETKDPLEVLATSEDGVIEAVRHNSAPITGMMWHPERNRPFEGQDVSLVKKLFDNKLK